MRLCVDSDFDLLSIVESDLDICAWFVFIYNNLTIS